MRVLSLFDGMSCGMLACQRAGIPINRYVAYEIDEYAIKVSSHNFPEIEQRGNVFNADFSEFTGFDLLIGGSPCTYWSIAQTKMRETEAHGIGWELFQQYARAVRESKPKFFIYENNKSMSNTIKAEISNTFGFDPIMINSALVSAQNRERYYWVGIRNSDGSYRRAPITQPLDRNIRLKDILEIKPSNNTRTNGAVGPIRVGSLPGPNGNISESQAMRIYHVDGKSVTLKACGGGGGAKTGLYAVPMCVNEATKKGYVEINAGECVDLAQAKSKTRRGRGMSIKSNCLTTSPEMYQYLGKIETPIYEVKNGTMCINNRPYPIKLLDGLYIIRKLDVSECKKLQTVPEWFDMSIISNSQAYKCLGNGWTVDVISHILSDMMNKNGSGYTIQTRLEVL